MNKVGNEFWHVRQQQDEERSQQIMLDWFLHPTNCQLRQSQQGCSILTSASMQQKFTTNLLTGAGTYIGQWPSKRALNSLMKT
jgi:hypothetical protein